MAQSITMPKLGLTMTEGTISKWNKAEGDAVAVGEVLFVVSTDKLTYEYQSEVSGVLLKIEVPENCSIAVGGEVALVGEAGEVVSSRSAPPRASDGREAPVAPAAVSSAASSAGKKKVVIIGGGPAVMSAPSVWRSLGPTSHSWRGREWAALVSTWGAFPPRLSSSRPNSTAR